MSDTQVIHIFGHANMTLQAVKIVRESNSSLFAKLYVSYLQVFHACYTKVLPSAEVENPELVAWSDSVAGLLDLDSHE
ncbi:hypothetical protein V6Z11_D01G097400 [Gossypium hirsutum]